MEKLNELLVTSSDSENGLSFEEILKKSEVDLSEELEKPEILLSIGQHEYKGNFYDTSVCTAGEFSAIVARSKAKKSFLKSALIASYIGGDTNILFPNIKTHRKEDFMILDFDTEQGKFYTQRTFRRVIDMVGDDQYDFYKGYSTRSLNAKDRLKLIDGCLKNQNKLYKKPIKLLAIDGIADLAENTNDIMMSKEVADYLLRWTYEYNIHIITVIHKGFGQVSKPLGHLGTFVLKKAETVFDLDVDNNTKEVNVSCTYSRGYSFEPFKFDVNKDSLPYFIE